MYINIYIYYIINYICILIYNNMTLKTKVKAKPKKVSRTILIKKLDTEFSIFIRKRKARNEIAECFTCGKKDNWKSLQCGHFMSRKHYSTRWNEYNCQVQCVGCNIYRYGEQYKFGVKLNEIYGVGCSENLESTTKQIFKISAFELEEKIDYYKILNKSLEVKN